MIQRINDFEDGTFNPKLIRDYSQEEFKQFKIVSFLFKYKLIVFDVSKPIIDYNLKLLVTT